MGKQSKLDSIVQAEKKIQLMKYTALEKALYSNDPTTIMKAQQVLADIQSKGGSDRKSFIIDPLEFQNSFGYKDRKISLSYQMLRGMARVPVINAIIKTRISQVAAFMEPQRDQYSVGYVIRKKRIPGAKDQGKLTYEEEKEIFELTEFLENCGEVDVWGSDDLDSFTRKIVRDSLSYDQMCFEVVRNNKGVPIDFYAVDGATMRLADSFDDKDYADNREVVDLRLQKVKGYYPSYAQIYNQNVEEFFYPWEMCFGVRNPTSDISNVGYGVSELEELVTVVTSLVWGEEYNRRFFKQGSSPKGILKVSGAMDSNKLAEFRQNWNATMRGVQNAWKTPILESDKVDWVDLQQSNKDMEYSAWMEFLIKISCAIYTIDPSEINFPLNGSSDSQPLFDGGNKDARVKFSKDKGLYPLLKFLQKRLNKYIINPRNPKYELAFVGMDATTPMDQAALDEKVVKTYKTVNEVRGERSLKPIEGGDVILDGSFMQMRQGSFLAGNGEEQEYNRSGGEEESIFEEEPEKEKAENPILKGLQDYFIDLNKR